MHTQTITFAALSNEQRMVKIGISVMEQPQLRFQGGEVKWFDESRLMKKRA